MDLQLNSSEQQAVFRGSLVVNGATPAPIRMQAGMKALTLSSQIPREVICGMDDDGIYARDAQEPALLPIFSCNFDVLEHIAVFSSHSKLCLLLKAEEQSSIMFGFEFPDASATQIFLKEALSKKHIKEWEKRQRIKMEKKIMRKKSNSLSPHHPQKEDHMIKRKGDDDLDERQAMIQLSQAHIDLLLAALSSQPMTVITSAKTLLKAIQETCVQVPARYYAGLQQLKHEFSQIVECVPQNMNAGDNKEDVLKRMAEASVQLLDAVKMMLRQYAKDRAVSTASISSRLPPPPNIDQVLARSEANSLDTLTTPLGLSDKDSRGSRESLVSAYSFECATFEELLDESLRVCQTLITRHSPAKDAEALNRIVEKKCKAWLKCAFPWVSASEPRSVLPVPLLNAGKQEEQVPTSPLAILLACYRLTYNPCELLQILVRVATQPPVDSRYSTAASAVEDARTHKSLARSGEFVDNSVFVLELLLHWVVAYWVDFDQLSSHIDALWRTLHDLHPNAQHRWLQDEVVAAVKYQMEHGLPQPPLHAHRQGAGPTPGIVMQLLPQTLAEQMALYNYELFSCVHTREYITYVFGGAPGEKQQVSAMCFSNLQAIIYRFEDEGQWVAAEIVQHKHRKEQATMIAKFLRVAEESLKLHNYFSFFTIMGALCCHEVSSLKRAWRSLPDKYKRLHATLEKLTDTSRNMKAYRDAWTNAGHSPKLPFLPLHLKDLYFAKEAWLSGGREWIESIDTWRLVSKIIRELMMWRPYKLFSDYGLQSYLRVSILRQETTTNTNHAYENDQPASDQVSMNREKEYEKQKKDHQQVLENDQHHFDGGNLLENRLSQSLTLTSPVSKVLEEHSRSLTHETIEFSLPVLEHQRTPISLVTSSNSHLSQSYPGVASNLDNECIDFSKYHSSSDFKHTIPVCDIADKVGEMNSDPPQFLPKHCKPHELQKRSPNIDRISLNTPLSVENEPKTPPPRPPQPQITSMSWTLSQIPFRVPSSPSLIALMQQADRVSSSCVGIQRRRQFALATLTSPGKSKISRNTRRHSQILSTVLEESLTDQYNRTPSMFRQPGSSHAQKLPVSLNNSSITPPRRNREQNARHRGRSTPVSPYCKSAEQCLPSHNTSKDSLSSPYLHTYRKRCAKDSLDQSPLRYATTSPQCTPLRTNKRRAKRHNAKNICDSEVNIKSKARSEFQEGKDIHYTKTSDAEFGKTKNRRTVRNHIFARQARGKRRGSSANTIRSNDKPFVFTRRRSSSLGAIMYPLTTGKSVVADTATDDHRKRALTQVEVTTELTEPIAIQDNFHTNKQFLSMESAASVDEHNNGFIQPATTKMQLSNTDSDTVKSSAVQSLKVHSSHNTDCLSEAAWLSLMISPTKTGRQLRRTMLGANYSLLAASFQDRQKKKEEKNQHTTINEDDLKYFPTEIVRSDETKEPNPHIYSTRGPDQQHNHTRKGRTQGRKVDKLRFSLHLLGETSNQDTSLKGRISPHERRCARLVQLLADSESPHSEFSPNPNVRFSRSNKEFEQTKVCLRKTHVQQIIASNQVDSQTTAHNSKIRSLSTTWPNYGFSSDEYESCLEDEDEDENGTVTSVKTQTTPLVSNVDLPDTLTVSEGYIRDQLSDHNICDDFRIPKPNSLSNIPTVEDNECAPLLFDEDLVEFGVTRITTDGGVIAYETVI